MNRKRFAIPLVLFFVLVIILLWQLLRNGQTDASSSLESTLLGQPLPQITLSRLTPETSSITISELLDGKPALINVWATWCPTCKAEHQYLRQLSRQGVRLIGVNYKDSRHKARQWLSQFGDPYIATLFDGNGMYGLELGVYGAPETFLVDGKGIIRYRHAGAVDEVVWHHTLQPLWVKYNKESTQP